MISSGFPSEDSVLADLGTDFVGSFIEAVDGAREDFDALRGWKPAWFANFTNRFTVNFLHERIWDRLVRAIEGSPNIKVIDREPTREIHSGQQYLIRIKRHGQHNQIAAYPTEGSSLFWSNSTLTLDGLESFALALGYEWDADLRAVGDAVLSFRDGKDSPIWAIRLTSDAAAPTGFSYVPVSPARPELDLSGIAAEKDAEEESA